MEVENTEGELDGLVSKAAISDMYLNENSQIRVPDVMQHKSKMGISGRASLPISFNEECRNILWVTAIGSECNALKKFKK